MEPHSLSKIAHLLNSRATHKHMPPLLYLTDEKRAPNPLPVISKLKPGTGVILRHYNSKSRLELGFEIREICKKNQLTFIVARDFSLGGKLGADGMHLPEHVLLSPPLEIQLGGRRPNKILTAAAHSYKSLLKCAALTINAALLSPVFPTQSHPGQPQLGVNKFQKLANQASVPVYALGGINDKTAHRLKNSSAVGIAGISALI